MSVAATPLPSLDDSFARELDGLSMPWHGADVPAPRLLAFNDGLAAELGLDADRLRSRDGVALLAGMTSSSDGLQPVAMAYAGHQFGGYSPRLGDGRALLLGELVDADGQRHDLHLKGSGRTPFARGGDGKAAVGPMLREYVISEAMHALGIPTTRALAVVATGEDVVRETMLPGAVLTRVAASHIRVGTFEYAAKRPDATLVQRLADHAIARHHPQALEASNPYLAFLEAVVEAQAQLIARWMLVGFVHGVMNTDNMSISGETIDYGPCAFLDAYDIATVFSSIDHGGRYAYGNQPLAAQWNLARLAEALLPLLANETEDAVALGTELLKTFPARYQDHWTRGMRAKLGLADGDLRADDALIDDLLVLLGDEHPDFTTFFRTLAHDPSRLPVAFDGWVARWRARVPAPDTEAMNRVNPAFIPRNHLVEDALTSATVGDLGPFEALVAAVTKPFEERPGLEAYAQPAPGADGPYVTYCGT